jgi:gamma-glutamyltranspeptidase/glutathione hydrolase
MRIAFQTAVVAFAGMLCACASPQRAAAPSPAGSPAVNRPAGPTLYTAVVAADHPVASRAGAQILEQGGNAVDAAVATAFTLSVVRPQSCGIGGGGFMVIRLTDRSVRSGEAVETTINYREWCPSGVTADTFEQSKDPKASTVGGLAVAVPGSVAGLLQAQEMYGRLGRAAVMQPAIDAAMEGFIVDGAYMTAAAETIKAFETDASLRKRFGFLWATLLREGGVREGDRITNPAQGFTLSLIAREGAAAFYQGPIAEAIVNATKQSGGVITYKDLEEYSRFGVKPQAPVRLSAFGRRFLTMAPPSSGGIALTQVMGMLGRRHDERLLGGDEAAFAHELTECFKMAFADRASFMADPVFTYVPQSGLVGSADISARADLIDATRTFPPDHYTRKEPAPSQQPEDHGTSHVSVVDRWGGAVALTETINLHFGSWVCAEPYGFLLNNQMDDFTTRRGNANAFGLRQSDENVPQHRKRPLSSMTPTIVLDANNQVEAVAGASGGPRIITATAQVLINALLRGDDAEAAVARPRLHHQWMPDILSWEPLADAEQDRMMTASLAAKGHALKPARGESAVQLIVRSQRFTADGVPAYTAASDPRKGGTPSGAAVGAAPVNSR